MALAAFYEGKSSKVRARLITDQNHLAIDVWDVFTNETRRSVIPHDQVEDFITDLLMILPDDLFQETEG